ncbi:hypothetical protein D6829_02095 [Candidatus Pacearchaeota archaeon]|nr:MAG: hypothetical protein D6829_02095 [Candidatus Pacearchaeota archaeon]
MFIKKIFSKNFDDEVHSEFMKFGRGEFDNRFLVNAIKQAGKWVIKTGPEYVNYLVKKHLEKVGETIFVKGIIVTTKKIEEDDLGFRVVKISNFQGIRKIQIEAEVETKKILDLMSRYPRAFYALSFSGDNFSIKVKAKAPKSGKPGKEMQEGPKADFCTLKTSDDEVIRELFFDVENFDEAGASHKVIIESIVYPPNVASLSPEEIRKKSKRKGRIIRTITVDGKRKESIAEFVV